MDSYVNIGELDTKVEVWSNTTGRGNQGQNTRVRTKHGDVFAKVDRDFDDGVSDDNYESGTEVSVLMYKIPAMTTRWQLVIEGVPYEITNIRPLSRISPFCSVSARTIQK